MLIQLTQRTNICACGNIIITRWRAFRLSEPICLTKVAYSHTSRKVTVFKKRITFFGRDKNKMEIDRMLYLLKSFVFVSLKFSFSILLFSLPISVNFSIFFHLFCEIAIFSYVFERELARESPKLIPSCMANIWPLRLSNRMWSPPVSCASWNLLVCSEISLAPCVAILLVSMALVVLSDQEFCKFLRSEVYIRRVIDLYRNRNGNPLIRLHAIKVSMVTNHLSLRQ